MMNVKMLRMAFAGLVLSVSGFANAGLIGDAVDLDFLSDGVSFGERSNLVVGAGNETSYFSNQFIDFDDLSFSVSSDTTYSSIDGAGGTIEWVLSDLDFGTESLVGVNFNIPYSNVSVTSLTANSVTFAYSDVSIPQGTYFSAQFITSAEVSEPFALSIFALGFMGLMARKFKK